MRQHPLSLATAEVYPIEDSLGGHIWSALKLPDSTAQKGKAFGKSEKLGNTEDPNGDQLIGATTIAVLVSGVVSHI